MTVNWYLLRDGKTQYGPYDQGQIKEFAAGGQISANDMLWQEGTPQWVPATSVPALFPAGGVATVALPAPAHPDVTGTKILAGVLAIILGTFGVHKFVLGMPGTGLIMLLLTITCFGWPFMYVISFVEGIMYLTRSDEDFYQRYVVGKQAWF